VPLEHARHLGQVRVREQLSVLAVLRVLVVHAGAVRRVRPAPLQRAHVHHVLRLPRLTLRLLDHPPPWRSSEEAREEVQRRVLGVQ
jgi:hypothetical protein